MLLDYSPDREGAEQDLYGSFVETEAVGYFHGSGRKLQEEPHFGGSIEGSDQPPIRDLTGQGQKRKVVSVAQLTKTWRSKLGSSSGALDTALAGESGLETGRTELPTLQLLYASLHGEFAAPGAASRVMDAGYWGYLRAL